jgi:putative NADH-flavin reductase
VRIAVVGATGRTGRRVVQQALAGGNEVVALARRPDEVTGSAEDDRLEVVRADVLDPDSLDRALTGVDAVVSTLGRSSSRTRTTLFSQGAANLLHAMDAHGVHRLVVVSALPVDPPGNLPLLQRALVLPLLRRFYGGTYDDLRRMEAVLARSDVAWTALRPPRLVDRPPTGSYRLRVGAAPAGAGSISFADLATALLDTLAREDLHRQAAYVAH